MASKEQQAAAKAKEAARAAEQLASDTLRAKAVDLSGVTGDAFDVLPEEERQKFIDAAQAALDAAAAAPLPTKIKLSCPFGYIDDAGTTHMWAANQEITDPAEIADLIAHGAEHEDLE